MRIACVLLLLARTGVASAELPPLVGDRPAADRAPARRPGDNPPGSIYTFAGQGQLRWSGAGSGPTGSLVLSGVPAGATIAKAYFVTGVWDYPTSTHAIDLTFAGTNLGIINAAPVDVDAGGILDLGGYLVDVTALVPGNGTYAFRFTAQQSGTGAFGSLLLVVYAHASEPVRRIQIAYGAESLQYASSSCAFSGFVPGPAVLHVFTEADNSGDVNESIAFAGSTILGGPAADIFDANQGNYYSYFELPVMAVTGADRVMLTTGGDWFGWHVAALVQSGAGSAPDVVVGQGAGAANPTRVRVYTTTGAPAPVDFLAYAPAGWGVDVTAGPADATPRDEIVTGAGPSPSLGSHVRGFQATGVPIAGVSLFAFGTLHHGVNVAAGDVDGDGFAEILAGAGPGTVFGPHVRGFNHDGAPATAVVGLSFYAYPVLRFGAKVGAGAMDGDGLEDVLTGPGPGPALSPNVRGFELNGAVVSPVAGLSFLAFVYPGYGVNVGAGSVDGDGFDEIVASPGPGPYPPRFTGFDFDATAPVALPGFDVTVAPLHYGGQPAAGDVDGGAAELIAGHGPDPAADSRVRTYGYTGTALVPRPLDFVPFPTSAHGTNTGHGFLGY